MTLNRVFSAKVLQLDPDGVFTLPRYGIGTMTVSAPCQGKVLDPLQRPVKPEFA